VASLSQGRTAAAQCGLFTYKSVPVIFEPPCTLKGNVVPNKGGHLYCCCMKWRRSLRLSVCSVCGKYFTWKWCNLSAVFFLTAHTLPFRYNRWAGSAYLPAAVYFPRKLMYLTAVIQRCVFSCFNKCRVRELEVT